MFIFQVVFQCNFHLFDCLLLIVHWYLFCFLYPFRGNSLSSVSLFPCVFARFVSVDSDRSAAFLHVVVEHSRSAEDETIRCRSSQDVSGNPPILYINQAITSRLTQAPGPPLSSRQHPVSPFSVSGPFLISVFRSRKFRRSCTVLQLLGRDEGPVSSKREFGFFLEIRFLALIWRLIFYKPSSLGQLRVEVSPRS